VAVVLCFSEEQCVVCHSCGPGQQAAASAAECENCPPGSAARQFLNMFFISPLL